MDVYYTLKKGQELTPEEIAEINALKNRPIVYDRDCPKLTGEQLAEFKPVNHEQRKNFRYDKSA